MNSSAQTPKLPMWIFIATDLALLGAAAVIASQSVRPFSPAATLAIVACALGGAVVGLVPIIVRFERQKNEALDERQRALEALARTLGSSADQLSIAAGSLHEIADLAQKNLSQADQLPHKLQEKIGEFRSQLTQAADPDRTALERELLALRTTQSERLENVAQQIAKSSADWARFESATQQQLTTTTGALTKLSQDTTSAIASARAEFEAKFDKAAAAVSARLAAEIGSKLESTARSLDACLARLESAAHPSQGAPSRDADSARETGLSSAPPIAAEAPQSQAPVPAVPVDEVSPTGATSAAAAPRVAPAEVENASAAAAIATTEDPAAQASAGLPIPESPSRVPDSVSERLPATAPTHAHAADGEPHVEAAAAPAHVATSTPKRSRKPRRVETPASTSPAEPAPPSLNSAATDAAGQPDANDGRTDEVIADPLAAPVAESMAKEEPAPIPAGNIPEVIPIAPQTAEPFSGNIASVNISANDTASPAPTPDAVAAQPSDRSVRRRSIRKPNVETEPGLGLDLEDSSAVSGEPPERVLTSDGATRLIVTAYIGIGNRLFIRGEGPGLSWEKGVPLQFISIGKWRWETNDASGPVQFKIYKNDDLECSALGAQTLDPGHQQEVSAAF